MLNSLYDMTPLWCSWMLFREPKCFAHLCSLNSIEFYWILVKDSMQSMQGSAHREVGIGWKIARPLKMAMFISTWHNSISADACDAAVMPQLCRSYAAVMPVVSTSEVQELINWSWTKGVNFECILGIIALRRMGDPWRPRVWALWWPFHTFLTFFNPLYIATMDIYGHSGPYISSIDTFCWALFSCLTLFGLAFASESTCRVPGRGPCLVDFVCALLGCCPLAFLIPCSQELSTIILHNARIKKPSGRRGLVTSCFWGSMPTRIRILVFWTFWTPSMHIQVECHVKIKTWHRLAQHIWGTTAMVPGRYLEGTWNFCRCLGPVDLLLGCAAGWRMAAALASETKAYGKARRS